MIINLKLKFFVLQFKGFVRNYISLHNLKEIRSISLDSEHVYYVSFIIYLFIL